MVLVVGTIPYMDLYTTCVGSNTRRSILRNAKMSKVINIADRTNDALMISPEQVLEQALEEVRSGTISKLMVITLDDSETNYDIGILQAGMRFNELLALTDITKNIIKEEMGY